jgi:NAD(P)-dependent dehydrogenase (short-subunit alcohol dehydrogenase family)
MNTEKRVLLITGASSGIGKACALAAAEYGFYVYVGCRKESDKINLEKLHPNICPVIFIIENETD